jgi:hypothetical protein
MVKSRRIVKNKKGWMRLVEVFVSILLIAGVLIAVNSRNSSNDNTFQKDVSQKEIAILRDIQLNDNLRNDILNVATLPLEWEDFISQIPNVRSRIVELSPKDFDCRAKLCELSDECVMEGLPEGGVYAESAVISATLNSYSPRQLKLFCVNTD